MPRTSSEPKGCLAFILSLFGIHLGSPAEDKEMPYRQRDDFLSPAEFSFYRVLTTAIGNRAVICPKVGLGDIFYVARSENKQSFKNKIDQKHVDFLLCDPTTMKPRLGIELDDASHGRADRVERDRFVDRVLKQPVCHSSVSRSFRICPEDISRSDNAALHSPDYRSGGFASRAAWSFTGLP